MAYDLYNEVYKGLYQRSYRNKEDDEFSEIEKLAYYLIRSLYQHKVRATFNKKNLRASLVNAKKLLDLEKNKIGYALYSSRLISELEHSINEKDNGKSLIINVPNQKKIPWSLTEDYLGNLYVAISKNRPGQCKLGVTLGNVEERLKKYSYKYGYSIELYYSRCDVLNAFDYEAAIAKEYKDFKHSGNTYNDSNEWYDLFPETLKNVIMKINQDLSVKPTNYI
jgi:hypothetical protein